MYFHLTDRNQALQLCREGVRDAWAPAGKAPTPPSAFSYKGRDHTEIPQFLQRHHRTPRSHSFWNATLTDPAPLPGFPRQPVQIRRDPSQAPGPPALAVGAAPHHRAGASAWRLRTTRRPPRSRPCKSGLGAVQHCAGLSAVTPRRCSLQSTVPSSLIKSRVKRSKSYHGCNSQFCFFLLFL